MIGSANHVIEATNEPQYRVVLAEDNEIIRELIAQQLLELGHTVIGKTGNGVEVVEIVARERPDVAIIDRGLPLQDGLAACRAIAASTPVPVVLLSAYVSTRNPQEEARAAGAHGFLAKPYLIEELDEAIQSAVDRFRQMRGA